MRLKYFVFTLAVMGCSSGSSEQSAGELYNYDVEEKINQLGIELIGPAIPPGVKIVSAVRTGNLVYLSGNGPLPAGSRPGYYGKVGKDITVEEGYAAARSTGINLLKALKD